MLVAGRKASLASFLLVGTSLALGSTSGSNAGLKGSTLLRSMSRRMREVKGFLQRPEMPKVNGEATFCGTSSATLCNGNSETSATESRTRDQASSSGSLAESSENLGGINPSIQEEEASVYAHRLALDLSERKLGELDAAHLSYANPNLLKLDLSNAEISSIVGVLSLPKLQELKISGNPRLGKALKKLAEHNAEDGVSLVDDTGISPFVLPSLKRVYASDCFCEADMAANLFSACPELEFIDLSNNPALKQEGSIISLKDTPKVETLLLGGCSSLPTQALSVLGGMRSLKKLDLSGCACVTLDFANYLRHDKVVKLNMSGIATDGCSKFPARLTSLKGLQALSLSYEPFEKNVHEIARSYSKLERLSIADTSAKTDFNLLLVRKIPQIVSLRIECAEKILLDIPASTQEQAALREKAVTHAKENSLRSVTFDQCGYVSPQALFLYWPELTNLGLRRCKYELRSSLLQITGLSSIKLRSLDLTHNRLQFLPAKLIQFISKRRILLDVLKGNDLAAESSIDSGANFGLDFISSIKDLA